MILNHSLYLIDRIALCIDDQKRFCTNSHHLLGKEAIKQRHLQLVGYQVVQVKLQVSGSHCNWCAKLD